VVEWTPKICEMARWLKLRIFGTHERCHSCLSRWQKATVSSRLPKFDLRALVPFPTGRSKMHVSKTTSNKLQKRTLDFALPLVREHCAVTFLALFQRLP
jgi:hypothetical protein